LLQVCGASLGPFSCLIKFFLRFLKNGGLLTPKVLKKTRPFLIQVFPFEGHSIDVIRADPKEAGATCKSAFS
jgi:hypothetical protein